MIIGDKWPAKADRNKRFKKSVNVSRALWKGETVTHKGLVAVEETTLYTRPEVKPLIIEAAISEETAEWVGG